MSDPLGLFGGAFNPIHHGHLIAIQETAHQLDLESVRFIPTAHPPHKATPDVTPEHRVTMTELALGDHDTFSVSTIELDTEGPSYSYNTLSLLREDHPDRELVFMVGSDELLQFSEWYNWEALLEEFTIVGMSRPGFDNQKIDDAVSSRCEFVDIPNVQVSSSLIRDRLIDGHPVRYFLPRAVWNYILEHELYGTTS